MSRTLMAGIGPLPYLFLPCSGSVSHICMPAKPGVGFKASKWGMTLNSVSVISIIRRTCRHRFSLAHFHNSEDAPTPRRGDVIDTEPSVERRVLAGPLPPSLVGSGGRRDSPASSVTVSQPSVAWPDEGLLNCLLLGLQHFFTQGCNLFPNLKRWPSSFLNNGDNYILAEGFYYLWRFPIQPFNWGATHAKVD